MIQVAELSLRSVVMFSNLFNILLLTYTLKRPRVEINNVNINIRFTNITWRLKARNKTTTALEKSDPLKAKMFEFLISDQKGSVKYT